jgi:type IV secretory pathway TraG/TraD family ATPase VirD4
MRLTTDGLVRFGAARIHPKLMTQHGFIVGATGSGKSLLMKGLISSALAPSLFTHSNRAVISDPKHELLGVLIAMGLGRCIKILNPLDQRASAWRIAQDIDTPMAARQLAAILLPDDAEGPSSGNSSGSDSGGFYLKAARDVVAAVTLVLMHRAPGRWTLRDILLCTLDPDSLQEILELDRDMDDEVLFTVHRVRRTYLDTEDGRTRDNLHATLSAHLGGLEPIAALWQKHEAEGRWFSLRQWMAGGQILVFSSDETARTVIDAMTRLLFKRICELLLQTPDVPREELEAGRGITWILWDEIRESGLTGGNGQGGLRSLFVRGRSKGVAIVMCFQDLAGLKAAWGEDAATEITSQCGYQLYLRLNSETTASWAARQFGRCLIEESSGSRSASVGGGSNPEHPSTSIQRGQQRSFHERSNVLDSDFLFIPPTGPAGLAGYHRLLGADLKEHSVYFHLAWKQVLSYQPPTSDAAGFEPAPIGWQYLKVWTPYERERLGLPREPNQVHPGGSQTESGETQYDDIEADVESILGELFGDVASD